MGQRMNVLSPEFRADPYPFYAELRRANPVCRVDPGGLWAVSRHADVVFMLKHPELFSSQGFKAAWQPPWVGYNPLANSMIALDPPGHTRLRGLVARAFGGRAVVRLEPRVRELAGRLAGDLAGEVEVVNAFAMPLPAFVIGELLGLEFSLRARFKAWADDILSVTPEPEGPSHVARVRSTIADLGAYLSAVIAERRRAPADDTVSDLIRAEVDGQSLSDREIADFLVLLLLGGLETTTHLIATTLLFLADHPDELAGLRADPSLVPRFLEEMLRYDGPSHSLPRFTTEEVTLAGVAIPRGALVLALVASANRDERKYPDPDRFDLRRESQGGLQFGHGVHFCIGAALARMEARAALEAVLAKYATIERVPGEVRYNRTMTVRGPVAARLRFVPG